MRVQDILNYINDVVTSAGEIPADESLDINVAVIKTLTGSGRKEIINTDDLRRKRSIIKIRNKDNACLPRAIVVGMAHLDMKKNPDSVYFKRNYDRTRNARNKYQGQLAKSLQKDVGIANRVGTLEDIKLY